MEKTFFIPTDIFQDFRIRRIFREYPKNASKYFLIWVYLYGAVSRSLRAGIYEDDPIKISRAVSIRPGIVESAIAAFERHRLIKRMSGSIEIIDYPEINHCAIREAKLRNSAITRGKVPFGYWHGESCIYCGNEAESTDHLIPVSRGGTSELSNLAPACKRCNSSKGAMTFEEYLNKLGI